MAAPSATGWDHGRRCDAVATEVERFAAAVEGADPGLAVPTCPEWALADLIEHAGAVHRWAETMVRERRDRRLRRAEMDLGLPGDRAGLPSWLAEGGRRLVATLRAADPHAPVWTWGADRHVRFWPRRMLHETTVHRVDAELALGRDPAVDPAVAVDGIEELLENLPYAASFSPPVAGLRGDGESLHLHCTDVEGEWTVRLRPDGFTWERGHAKGTAAVRATAADLLLLLYRRRGPEESRVETFGEAAVLDRWLAGSVL